MPSQASSALAQPNEIIELINGSTITGNVGYRDVTGFLFHFIGSDRKQINVDSVKRSTIVDKENNRTRNFEILPHSGTSGKIFQRPFEILRQTNSISLLCLKDPININTYNHRSSQVVENNRFEIRSKTTQQEIIYFRENRGALYPHLLIEYKVGLDDLSRSQKKQK